MLLKDDLGLDYTGGNAASLAVLQFALHEFRCYQGDPVASVDRALAAGPDLAMGWALRAWLHLLGTEPGQLAAAREAIGTGLALNGNDRERRHLQAAALLAANRWHAAGRVLEDLAIDYPLDSLALQAGHQIDFFTGESRMLRDRIARALPAWSAGMPGYHAVLGMWAFGLEESGEYRAAEAAGRRSVELEPKDGWGQHAVAHVLEMENRREEGIAWMRGNLPAWSDGSFFAVHNWWHLALFHLGLGDEASALQLWDERVYGRPSGIILEMIDAAALLWRLELRGVDVGNRWAVVADGWEPVAIAGNYAFNDLHAMLCFVGARREAPARALLAAQDEALAQAGGGDNLDFLREVGRPATRAIEAFGRGAYAECVDWLRPIRNRAGRFGGSHAQRDLLDLTLIAAAERAGQRALATALRAERRPRVVPDGAARRTRAAA